LQDLQQMHDILKLDDERSVERVEWTDDGQLLGVSTPSGHLHVYLTELPIIGASYMTRIAYLSSLQEITLQNGTQQVKPLTPTCCMLSLGLYHDGHKR